MRWSEQLGRFTIEAWLPPRVRWRSLRGAFLPGAAPGAQGRAPRHRGRGHGRICRHRRGVGVGRQKNWRRNVTPTSDPNGIAVDPSTSTQPLVPGQGSPAPTEKGGFAPAPGVPWWLRSTNWRLDEPSHSMTRSAATGRAHQAPRRQDRGLRHRLYTCRLHGRVRPGFRVPDLSLPRAAFDPAKQAQAIAGLTDQPLATIPIHVDKATGRVTLTG